MLALEYRARSVIFHSRKLQRSILWQKAQPSGLRHQRGLTTTTEPDQPSTISYSKPYYVTSPIFYVNSAPHVGHLYSMVLADVLKRWANLKGDKRARLLTGTDEHGMKVQKAAEKAQTDVQHLCDHHAEQFKNLADAANISYDRFMRTTDEDHKELVRYVWEALNRNGYIYEAKHEGWYSVSDETFYPATQIHKILDPATGTIKIVSKETGKDVEWTSEVNYHFRLSEFQQPLLAHYENNPGAIVPKQRMNFIMEELRGGLKDLSISRPSSRLTWGIRVPGDESQTVYVWLDALFNYLTMTGYPFSSSKETDAIWPPNCQVIGKDIIRFHTIYWPAFLMALNLPVTTRYLSHAHWTLNNAKMSKSAGNGVDPFQAMDRFGVDGVRFYMVHNGGIVDDAMYENSYIADTYNHLLKGGLGNLVNRVFGSKNFSVRDAIEDENANGDLAKMLTTGNANEPDMQPLLDNIALLHKSMASVRDLADRHMLEPDPRKAIQAICALIGETNVFFSNSAVWNLVKSHTRAERRMGQHVLFASAEAVRIMAILLQPFMPERMKTALDMMEVDETNRTFEHATFGADFTYGTEPVSAYADRQIWNHGVFPALLTSH